jgi:hypothetical protein
LLLAECNAAHPPATRLQVRPPCGVGGWQVTENVPWLVAIANGEEVQVRADPTGLAVGVHTGALTLSATGAADAPPQTIPVTLCVLDTLHRAHIPVIMVD